jgi:hypothetical protein
MYYGVTSPLRLAPKHLIVRQGHPVRGHVSGCLDENRCPYFCRYEPWGLMYRPALGFFDVRYRGYGRNKVQHLHMHLKQLGWR